MLVKVSAVSLGGGGTRAEVADGDMGTISIEVTSVADGVEFNLPPSKWYCIWYGGVTYCC